MSNCFLKKTHIKNACYVHTNKSICSGEISSVDLLVSYTNCSSDTKCDKNMPLRLNLSALDPTEASQLSNCELENEALGTKRCWKLTPRVQSNRLAVRRKRLMSSPAGRRQRRKKTSLCWNRWRTKTKSSGMRHSKDWSWTINLSKRELFCLLEMT